MTVPTFSSTYLALHSHHVKSHIPFNPNVEPFRNRNINIVNVGEVTVVVESIANNFLDYFLVRKSAVRRIIKFRTFLSKYICESFAIYLVS